LSLREKQAFNFQVSNSDKLKKKIQPQRSTKENPNKLSDLVWVKILVAARKAGI
jgi:hypothetical protein